MTVANPDPDPDPLLTDATAAPSLGDLERLVALWRSAQEAGVPAAAPHDAERVARSLNKLRLAAPPEGLAAEVAEVWRRHEQIWATESAVTELVSELDKLLEPIERSEAVLEQRSREVATLRLRSSALEELAQVLDLLSGDGATTNDDPGGDR